MSMHKLGPRGFSVVTAVALLPLLSACGASGAVSSAASNAASVASKAASVAASAASANAGDSSSAPAESNSPAGSTAPAGTSTIAAAADYCGAFTAMQKVAGKGDVATAVAVFHQSAADMKKYAPAEIADSANAYADILDKVASAIEAHQAQGTSTLAKELGANPKALTDVATYVAKHCVG